VLVDPARGTPAGRCQRLAPGLLMSSAPRVATAGAGDPVRGVPAGPVPAAGAQAADELSAQGGHCWSWRSGSRCSGGAGACGWRSATSGGLGIKSSAHRGARFLSWFF